MQLLLDHAEWLDMDGDVWIHPEGGGSGSDSGEGNSDEGGSSSSALPHSAQHTAQQQHALNMAILLNNLQPCLPAPALLLPASLRVLNMTGALLLFEMLKCIMFMLNRWF